MRSAWALRVRSKWAEGLTRVDVTADDDRKVNLALRAKRQVNIRRSAMKYIIHLFYKRWNGHGLSGADIDLWPRKRKLTSAIVFKLESHGREGGGGYESQ